jgi:hypothetical protein
MDIFWRGYTARAVEGHTWTSEPHLPQNSGELLLKQIVEMPKSGRAISYDEACNLFMHHVLDYLDSPGANREECGRLVNTFVEWVSAQGYWIELRGDEYRASNVRH